MEEKYWKQFESSGRVEDYLSFVSSTRGIWKDTDSGEGERESSHAGIHHFDGDHPETVSGGRI